MKKEVSQLIIIVFLLISNVGWSQSLISGWKTGVNLSGMTYRTGYDDMDEEIAEENVRQVGIDLGVFNEISLGERWLLNTDVFYQLRRYQVFNLKAYFSYLNINPSIVYRAANKMTIKSGLNTGILINALNVIEFLDPLTDNPGGSLGAVTEVRNVNKYYTTFDLQWSAGLEFEISSKLGLEFRGALSLLDLNAKYNTSPGIKHSKLKFHSISISTKYYLQ